MSKSKVVFISGGARGIGEALARRFSRAGWCAVVSYRQDEGAANQVMEDCLRLGALEVFGVRLDLSQDQSIIQAVRQIVDRFGRIDVLINNAGTMVRKPFLEQTISEIEYQMRVNLEGHMKLTRQCLPYIKEAVVNIGSALGLEGHKQLAAYSAAKFGIRGFTQGLAKDCPDLLVFAVHPGLTATRMGNWAGFPPERVAEIIFNLVIRKYRVVSGADVKIRDYRWGPGLKLFVVVVSAIKNCLKHFFSDRQV
jgi:NAD(P)-dependent dehydrogenase (short-subunit alcohol dehydrogenase family)